MNNEQNTITPFLFGDSTVRTTLHEAAPWFVIADVCEVLGITNSRNVLKRLHEEDVHTMDVFTQTGRKTVNVCNESGLYQLIFQSRKAAAREFTRWVTSVVLPTIRRTGSYSSGHQAFLGLLREQLSLGVSPDLAARIAAKLSPAAAPAPRGSTLYSNARAFRSTMHPADELVGVMEEDRRYTTDELLALLPTEHRIHTMKPGRGKQSALGRLLHSYVKDQRLRTEINHGRSFYYRPKVVVEFATR
jgi:hypothetical protein